MNQSRLKNNLYVKLAETMTEVATQPLFFDKKRIGTEISGSFLY